MIQNALSSFILAGFVIAAFLAALMPFTQHEAAWFMASVFLTGLAALFALAGTEKLQLLRSPLTLMAAAFWLLALVSVLLSQVPYVSFVYFCFFSVFPLTLLTASLATERERFFKIAGWGIGFVVAGLALSCTAQYFFFPQMLRDGLAHRPLADPNAMAGILSFGFFAGIGIMLGSSSRLISNLALFFCVVVFAGLLTTGSRAAFVIMLPALAVFLFLAPAFVKKHRRCLWALAVASAGLFLLLIFAAPGPVSPASEILSLSGSALPSMESRAGLWESAWTIIQNHFWTGTGIGTFFLYYPEVRGGDVVSSGLMAHNDPLQFWAEMGVLAPLLFYGFIILAIRRTWKVLTALAPEDPRRVQILEPFCALGAMILHAHLTFHFYTLPMLVLAALLLGYWFEQTKAADDKYFSIDPAKIFPFFTAKTAISLALMALLISFVCVQGGYVLVEKGKARIAAGDIDGYAAAVNRADRLSYHTNEQAFILAATVPMGVLEAQLKAISGEEIQKLFLQGYDLLGKAEALNPRLAAIPYFRARLITAAGPAIDREKYGEPEALLQEALKLDPLHLSSRLMLAEIYKKSGDKKKALEILKDGMKWRYKNQDPAAYYETTAWLALDQDDMQTHVQAMQKMMEIVKARFRPDVENPVSGNFRAFLPGE